MYDNFKSDLVNQYSKEALRKRKHKKTKVDDLASRMKIEYRRDIEFYINIVTFNYNNKK